MEYKEYTVSYAFELGDKYKKNGHRLAAQCCYALTHVTDHPTNKCYDEKMKNNNITNEQKIQPHDNKIPQEVLELIKSFYSVWLNPNIKTDLNERAEKHVRTRAYAIIDIFAQVTATFDNIGELDIALIINKAIQKHKTKILTWDGPRFKHLKYKKNTNRLTVVMSRNEYRKRCRNSQELWFTKYDGEFFAECLIEIAQILQSRLLSTKIDLAKIEFAEKLLYKKVQFALSAPKPLLPAGTLFKNNEVMIALNKFHKDLDAASIKKNEDKQKNVTNLHAKLLSVCTNISKSLKNTSGNTATVVDINNNEILNGDCRIENNPLITGVGSNNIQSNDNYFVRHSTQSIFQQSNNASVSPQQYAHFSMNSSTHYNIQSSSCAPNTPLWSQSSEILPFVMNPLASPVYDTTSLYSPMNHRPFQNSVNYLIPSQRMHNNIVYENNRQQRYLDHMNQMQQ